MEDTLFSPTWKVIAPYSMVQYSTRTRSQRADCVKLKPELGLGVSKRWVKNGSWWASTYTAKWDCLPLYR